MTVALLIAVGSISGILVTSGGPLATVTHCASPQAQSLPGVVVSTQRAGDTLVVVVRNTGTSPIVAWTFRYQWTSGDDGSPVTGFYSQDLLLSQVNAAHGFIPLDTPSGRLEHVVVPAAGTGVARVPVPPSAREPTATLVSVILDDGTGIGDATSINSLLARRVRLAGSIDRSLPALKAALRAPNPPSQMAALRAQIANLEENDFVRRQLAGVLSAGAQSDAERVKVLTFQVVLLEDIRREATKHLRR
jgi:hypothetical protein